MLRNIFFALFVFGLALPALGVPIASVAEAGTVATDCHNMPTQNQDDGAEKQKANAQLHSCIGCIVVVSRGFEILALAPLPFFTPMAQYHLLLGTIAGPIVPPPRY
jgi:hypothetical protein